MSKTEKELAFLRDLYIETDYTERFTDLFDDNFKFTDERTILYLNAGAGNHALALREKQNETVEIFGVSETAELLNIARHKADAVQANVDFSTVYPNEKYEAVLADASLTKPTAAKDLLNKAVESASGQVAFFLPTASSFGEIFSLLWEAFLNADLAEKGAAVERLISDIPTVSTTEAWAEDAGLRRIETVTKTESFEFENGAAFVDSPLVQDFLLPAWLDFLSGEERKRVIEKLVAAIDEDCAGMIFQFSVKATLLVGEKAPVM